jgi:hypothetical protein
MMMYNTFSARGPRMHICRGGAQRSDGGAAGCASRRFVLCCVSVRLPIFKTWAATSNPYLLLRAWDFACEIKHLKERKPAQRDSTTRREIRHEFCVFVFFSLSSRTFLANFISLENSQ